MRPLVERWKTLQTRFCGCFPGEVAPELRPPASPEALAQLEELFGETLPPSFRAFLEVSDGCRHFSGTLHIFGAADILSPTYGDQVDLFRASKGASQDDVALAGFVVGFSEEGPESVLLDRTRSPDAEGEFPVVRWKHEEYFRSASFHEFLQYHADSLERALTVLDAPL